LNLQKRSLEELLCLNIKFRKRIPEEVSPLSYQRSGYAALDLTASAEETPKAASAAAIASAAMKNVRQGECTGAAYPFSRAPDSRIRRAVPLSSTETKGNQGRFI
jgi:hypothetical protein